MLTVSGDQDRDDEAVDLSELVRGQVPTTTDQQGGPTAMIPAMTTGTTHFIIRSGRSTDIAETPTPDFAVP